MNENFTIRFAKKEDTDNIMTFIKDNWSKDHILANWKKFFEYQYTTNDRVNFVLSEKNETKNITAILGFIEYDKGNMHTMLALWKANDTDNPFIGVQLLERLIESKKEGIVSCVGINKKTVGIYKYLGHHTGELNHYFRLADKDSYSIADIKSVKKILINNQQEYELIKIDAFEELEEVFDFGIYKKIRPDSYKEPWYIKKRYFCHPTYKYLVYGIKNNNGEVNSVLIGREQEQNGVKIFRIVDLLGETNDIAFISYDLQKLIDLNDYEYTDFYQYGISDEVMRKAGFVLKTLEDIIPNYFEPFVKENVEIRFFTTKIENALFFKADGDQDRPNFYNKEGLS